MHPLQPTEAIQWAEVQHQDLMPLAEREQPARSLHQWPKTASAGSINVTGLVMRTAAVVLMMIALAVGGI